MHIIGHYLFLKLKLFYRSLGKYRAPISIALVLVFILSVIKFYTAEAIASNHVHIGIFAGIVLIFQYHLKRVDKDFLINQIGKRNALIVLACEYGLISIPLSFLLMMKGFQVGLVFIIVPFILPFLPNNLLRSSFHLSPFGKGNFEWNSGLRLFSLIQWILLLAFVASCIFQLNFYMSMALMAFILISFGFYYNINEDPQMIIAYRNSGEMLLFKLVCILKNMSIIGLVLGIVLSLFYMQFDWLVLLIFGQSIVLAVTAMLVKYAFYPNKNASDLQLSILYIVGLIPFLSPLLLVLCFHYFKRAKIRLNPFFNY